ncbi:MAG: DUF2829 domain-containing protein [Candidatus Faecousia sp.]|nr:DUF2829 domain-containing protein [Candidatus Faecousia sp.]
MKQYIGTKIIQAEPAYRVDGKVFVKANIVPSGVHIEDGYKVVYPDGYESWSPKDVFEAAYRATDGMSFGLAIEAAKMGKKIARAGWNGKNQYVELASCISYKNGAGEIVNVEHDAIGNKALAFVGTSGVQMGWLASQADMLADDWKIVE